MTSDQDPHPTDPVSPEPEGEGPPPGPGTDDPPPWEQQRGPAGGLSL